ncbi:MAG: arabinogalactan endo-1,4-beta-galactosidase [Bacteroidales bacterium]|nr:arabinogalactan endo-1,4-beta-galactosidase [Bacteroidales bacterium]
MKNMFATLLTMLAVASMQTACTDDSPITQATEAQTEETAVSEVGSFAKGADVSWLTQMENEGLTFANKEGVATECMKLLRDDCYVNSIRLRVWVNPAEGWNNADDVLVKARRAVSLGLRVMIDFHFSDTWADPGHQTTPAAWSDYDLTQMKSAVAEHVRSTLTKLKTYGVTPEWVQIGNETRTGMLWPLGSTDNGGNFAALVNAGYDAVKEVFADAKVIVHVDGGDNLALYTYLFGNLKSYNGKYDMVGMSLYPETGKSAEAVAKCISNVTTIYNTYGKPVMICEVGMDYDQAEECRDCIASLISQGKATGHLEGIFYWEPQAPAGYNGGYNKGCFSNGRPTVALDAFAE